MKKSIYCVGQKVIFESAYKGRQTGLVIRIENDNSMCLDLGHGVWQFTNPNDERVTPIENYLDPTSYYYHHSRFSEFQDRAAAFSSYMFAIKEIEESHHEMPARILAKLQGHADKAATDYVIAIELRDLASTNLNQWFNFESGKGYALDHHFPFINPNELQGYDKF